MTIGAISKVLSFPLSFVEGKLRKINFRDKKVALAAMVIFAGCFAVFCLVKKCFFSASAQVESKKYNKEELLAEIEKGNIYALQQAVDELKDTEGQIDDLEVMKAAVQKPGSGWALRFASACLQDNDELVGLAVANDTTGGALGSANTRFRENRALVKTTLTQCPNALAWLIDYQDDEEMISLAIENEKYGNDPDSLSGYGEKMEYEAVEHTVFKHASPAKRDDLDWATFAIENNRRAYLVVSDRLKVHPEVVKLAKDYAFQCRQDQIILNHIKHWNP